MKSIKMMLLGIGFLLAGMGCLMIGLLQPDGVFSFIGAVGLTLGLVICLGGFLYTPKPAKPRKGLRPPETPPLSNDS